MGPELAYRCKQMLGPLGVLKRSGFKPACFNPDRNMRYVRALCLTRLLHNCAAWTRLNVKQSELLEQQYVQCYKSALKLNYKGDSARLTSASGV
eukprot:5580145-Pyramimonas_sp.AAC.1